VPGFTDDKEKPMNDQTVRPTRRRDTRQRRGVVASVVAIAIGATMLSVVPAGAGAAASRTGVDTAAVEQVLRSAGVVADAPAVTTQAAPDSVAPDSVAPDSVAPDGVVPDSVAPDGVVPDSVVPDGAPDSVVPDGAPAGGADRAVVPVSTATVSVKAGLSVTAGSSVVRMRPVVGTASGAALSPSGLAVFGNGADSAIALSTTQTGANAGYVVIAAGTAPTAYQFQLTVDGRPAVLRLAAEGAVDVLDGTGTIVNSIAPAWARGADGSQIATSYAVADNILTQTVEHRGASYPVVADPLIRCDGLWCTALLSRAETRQVAAGSFAPGALCAWFGAVGRLCSTLILGGWAHANVALSRGQCTAFRVWQQNLISWPHLAYVSCYA
jgi:hypothetical protein